MKISGRSCIRRSFRQTVHCNSLKQGDKQLRDPCRQIQLLCKWTLRCDTVFFSLNWAAYYYPTQHRYSASWSAGRSTFQQHCCWKHT